MSAQPSRASRWAITTSVVLGALMYSLDTTIANVSLQHIQGSMSAGPEQIAWVLTSYLVASAIMTPLSGWLADRFGRRRVFIMSMFGFIGASMLCGIAGGLSELVAFRVLQGLFGAAIMPLSQTILLDSHPPEEHGQAMGLWSMGTIMGPILGPALGGYLTEYFSWRWCFFINLPIGILALIGVVLFVPEDRERRSRPFDFLGFSALTLAIASVQLLLDRGPSRDWFSSREIWTEAVLAAMALWVFLTHTLTAAHPFFDPRLFRDRNLVSATAFGFFFGVLMFASLAIMPAMMQTALGYPVLTAGIVSMPRGIASFATLYLAGRLVGRVDSRLILLAGLILTGIASWQMTRFDLSMSPWSIVTASLVQGFGVGLLFVPLTVLGFATLPQTLRAEGSAFFAVIRGLGASVGVSVAQALLVTNTQTMHASLAAGIIPSDPMIRDRLPPAFSLDSVAGLSALNTEITRQATMVAYIDDFKAMVIVVIVCAPILLLMRPPRRATEAVHVAIE